MLRTLLIALLLMSLTTQANAQNLTGNQLHSFCSNGDEPQLTFCAGYITGVTEGLFLGAYMPIVLAGVDFDNVHDVNEFVGGFLGYCPPYEVTKKQIIDIATKYLEDHPESRHETARFLIYMAYQEAFPCAD